MQIQLRQSEIEAALKQYVTSQGINLKGKKVEIAFTAGRKEAGMSADISIEDLGALPDLTGDDANETTLTKPALAVVGGTVPPVTGAVASIANDQTEVKQVTSAEPAAAPAAANEAKVEEAAAPAPAKATSLFG
jgi:hypothetical protein